jgi:hypothetical protein
LIAEAIELARSGQADPPQDDLAAWQAFEASQKALTAWVGGDGGAFGELTRLVRADRELTPAGIPRWLEYIEGLRAAQREHARKGLGDPPYLDRGAVQIAVVDAVALAAALGQPERALDLICPLTGLFPPLLELVRRDPLFSSMREGTATQAAYSAWLTENAPELTPQQQN